MPAGARGPEAAALPEADQVLKDWWRDGPDDRNRRDWISRLLLALEQLDAADITTIHGFSRRSLAPGDQQRRSVQLQLETDSAALVQEVVQEIYSNNCFAAAWTAGGTGAGRLL